MDAIPIFDGMISASWRQFRGKEQSISPVLSWSGYWTLKRVLSSLTAYSACGSSTCSPVRDLKHVSYEFSTIIHGCNLFSFESFETLCCYRFTNSRHGSPCEFSPIHLGIGNGIHTIGQKTWRRNFQLIDNARGYTICFKESALPIVWIGPSPIEIQQWFLPCNCTPNFQE